MQKRKEAEKRQECCVSCRGNEPFVRPVDFDVDFEGLAMAWKEVSDPPVRRG